MDSPPVPFPRVKSPVFWCVCVFVLFVLERRGTLHSAQATHTPCGQYSRLSFVWEVFGAVARDLMDERVYWGTREGVKGVYPRNEWQYFLSPLASTFPCSFDIVSDVMNEESMVGDPKGVLWEGEGLCDFPCEKENIIGENDENIPPWIINPLITLWNLDPL